MSNERLGNPRRPQEEEEHCTEEEAADSAHAHTKISAAGGAPLSLDALHSCAAVAAYVLVFIPRKNFTSA